RPHGEAQVVVAEVEPQAFVPRRRAADDGQHVGQTGPAPQPRLGVHARTERKDLACQRLHLPQLHGRRRRIAQRALRAGGEANALYHRGEGVSVLRVDERPVERGVALGPEVHVIAALDAHRQIETQRAQHVDRPRTECHDGRIRHHRPFARPHLPLALERHQRARVALEKAPATLGEETGIGLGDPAGVGHAHGLGHPHPTGAGSPQVRLDLGKLLGIDHLELDAVGLAPVLVLEDLGSHYLGRAVEPQVAGAPHHADDPSLLHQRLVLDDAALDQRPRSTRRLGKPGRGRREPVAEEVGRDPGQGAPVQVGLGAQIEGVLGHQPEVAREGVGHHPLALDDAGVAVARLLAGPAPVDEHHRATPLLQVQGGRDADHAGAKHDHISVLRIAQGRSRLLRPGRAGEGSLSPLYDGLAIAAPARLCYPIPMIPRYTRPEMAAVWAPEARYRIWFEIEAHAATAMADLGLIPKSAAAAIWEKGAKARFDTARIDAIEREVKHDVIAFLTHLAEHVGPEARFVHAGLTSSDVLDTCLAVQLVRAADLLIADLDGLLAALERRAMEHKLTPTVGRSHGIHAEPTTFGLKLAQAYAEFARARERMVRARAEVATCAISGAVGTFANVDPRVEAYVAGQLGLAVEPISTQVIPRDRHAMYF